MAFVRIELVENITFGKKSEIVMNFREKETDCYERERERKRW